MYLHVGRPSGGAVDSCRGCRRENPSGVSQQRRRASGSWRVTRGDDIRSAHKQMRRSAHDRCLSVFWCACRNSQARNDHRAQVNPQTTRQACVLTIDRKGRPESSLLLFVPAFPMRERHAIVSEQVFGERRRRWLRRTAGPRARRTCRICTLIHRNTRGANERTMVVDGAMYTL